MQRAEIAQRLRAFVVENYLFGQDGGLQDSDSFLEKGIIDSTGVLELVAFLQDSFGVVMDEQEMIPDNLDSLSKVTAYLGRKLKVSDDIPAPGAVKKSVE